MGNTCTVYILIHSSARHHAILCGAFSFELGFGVKIEMCWSTRSLWSSFTWFTQFNHSSHRSREVGESLHYRRLKFWKICINIVCFKPSYSNFCIITPSNYSSHISRETGESLHYRRMKFGQICINLVCIKPFNSNFCIIFHISFPHLGALE